MRDREANYDRDEMPPMTPTVSVTFRDQHELVDHNMTNHAPAHPGVVDQFESLRRAAKLFAHTIVDTCPETRERSLALTNAAQALMWAMAAIAPHQ
jgi:hypothetical protein